MSKTPKTKHKLKKIDFVKPLYKKYPIKLKSRVKRKLDGIDICVKRHVFAEGNNNTKSVYLNNEIHDDVNDNLLPGTCFYDDRSEPKVNESVVISVNPERSVKMSEVEGSSRNTEHLELGEGKQRERNKIVQVDLPENVCKNEEGYTWLRVYPARTWPGETCASMIFRCIACQIGLICLLTLWTVAWSFIISYFEEPYEQSVSEEFRKKQNQLVIDLATELRQITPVSTKWLFSIEKQIQRERELTISAVGRGARLEPGCFWGVSGTFLFTVYVMTALGFGAPVPQSILGRYCALLYAFLAVPVHVTLMVHTSTCIVAKLDKMIKKHRNKSYDMNKRHHSRSSNSDISVPDSKLRKCCCSVLYFWQGMPFLAVMFYTTGALVFGVARGRPPLDVIMFPLEFTTTGGLELITGYVRVVYGLYVEGAMVLLSCMLAVARRNSTGSLSALSNKYKLLTGENRV